MSLLGDLVRGLFGRAGARPQTTGTETSERSLTPELKRWLGAAYTFDGEAAEEEALELLRAMGPAGVDTIRSAYGGVAVVDPDLGWALVRCAAQLRSPAATAFLVDVLAAPIGEERSFDVHLHSSVGDEVAMRFQAIRGLRDLALDGDDQARAALHEALAHPVFAVRAHAHQELREHFDQDETWRDRVREDDRAALERLRRVDITDVGQLAPVDLRYLAHPDDPHSRSPHDQTPQIRGSDYA